MTNSTGTISRLLIALLFLGSMASAAHAQSVTTTPEPPLASAGSTNLVGLYRSIEERQTRLSEMHSSIQQSGIAPSEEQQAVLDELSADIRALQNTFAQLATGGIEIIETGTENEEFDWRKEIILVTQPLLENLKGLTEKPRKIERLKTIVKQREDDTLEIDNALANLDKNLSLYPEQPTQNALKELRLEWKQRHSENLQGLELSRFQLATLLGDNTPRIDSIKQVILEFLNGRGLTIGLAVLVSIILWLMTRGLLWLILHKKKREAGRSRLVSHRLASYGYSFFTTVLIIIGVMVVLYVRGDLLLLALAIVVFVSIALSLRTVLPQFVSEARLLLNIGAIREGERVMYEGLPYEVKAINVHSYLKNPHLSGVIRLPLVNLKNMTSRPASNEEWFPSHPGEVLLMEDGTVVEVLSQTPEFVELRNRTGTINYIPTGDFIALNFDNLTRSGKYMVVTYFGVDYGLQNICLDVIPAAFQQHITDRLSSTDHAQHVLSVRVDFNAAGASSLDYVLFVELHSDAALAKYKIERIMQQACVEVCNRQNWTIPFPQLTVHQGGNPADSAQDDPDGKVPLQAVGR